jgi:hypothetical protein
MVADRQIGVRVRSFAPFFERHGRIALLDDATAYERYRPRVPALFPFFRPRTPSA